MEIIGLIMITTMMKMKMKKVLPDLLELPDLLVLTITTIHLPTLGMKHRAMSRRNRKNPKIFHPQKTSRQRNQEPKTANKNTQIIKCQQNAGISSVYITHQELILRLHIFPHHFQA